MSSMGMLFIITQSPYSTAAGQEALDMMLSACSFEQTVSLLFMQDGVFQIKRQQSNTHSELKQYTKSFLALHDFGVERIYAHDASLFARGLNNDDLWLDVNQVSAEQIGDIIKLHSRVITV